MGKAVGSITKSVKKAVNSATKATKNFVKSAGKSVETSVSAVKHLAQGDVSGAISKIGKAAENMGNTATFGTADFTGRNDGMVNIDADKYANAAYGAIKSLVGGNKVKDKSTSVNTDIETDGLLQYVSDLRTRKSRRSRASTNNTDGSASNNTNKLSGTTALGV